MVEIERCTLLPGSVERAFDLSLDINAHLKSLSASDERAVDGVREGLIGLSETVTWRARHFGVTWTMTSQITEWDRPGWFADEQVRGPFKSFRHEHEFRPVGDQTEMRDRVVFTAPAGVIGRLVERLVLRRYLARLIDVRNAYLTESLGTEIR